KDLVKHKSQLGPMQTAAASGDPAKVSAAAASSPQLMKVINIGAAALFEQLSCDYMLVTHLKGTEQDYEGGKPVKLFAGLVNIKTGKLRYFGEVEGKKGAVPVPFAIQLGMMANNILSAAD